MDVVESGLRVYRMSQGVSPDRTREHGGVDARLFSAGGGAAWFCGRQNFIFLLAASLQELKKTRKRLFGTTDVEISAQHNRFTAL